MSSDFVELREVTPCVGVWIEMVMDMLNKSSKASLPAWECGLK